MAETVLINNRDARTAAGIARPASGLVIIALLAMWALGWLPNLVTLLASGRGQISGLAATVETTPLASNIASALTIAISALLAIAILLGLTNVRSIRPGPYILLLAAWAVLYALRGEGLALSTLLLPLFVVAWMLVRPPANLVYRLLAWIGLSTAAISIGFALISPLAFMSVDWTANAEKALIGDEILAGPYSHSNALGLCLALTLPFAVLYFRRWARALAVVMIGVGLIWSASRLSTAAAVIALALSLLVIRLGERTARRLLSAVIVIGSGVLVLLPVLTSDPLLFTNRGRIWMTSLAYTYQGPWLFGGGGSVFREINALTTELGFVSTTGHNAFVTFFTAGGAIVLGLVVIMAVIAYGNSRRVFSSDRYRLLFIAIIVVLSIAEDPIRALALGPQSFVIYPMFLILLDTSAARFRLQGPEVTEQSTRQRRGSRAHMSGLTRP
jgi:hypothetical protein